MTTGKDKVLRQFDIRSTPTPISQTVVHGGNRNSRAIWLGNSPYILSCGHTSSLDREVTVWDSRSMDSPVKRERIDSSTGMLIPLFDPDTGLLVLAGKGDTSARLYEFDMLTGMATSNKPPFFPPVVLCVNILNVLAVFYTYYRSSPRPLQLPSWRCDQRGLPTAQTSQ